MSDPTSSITVSLAEGRRPVFLAQSLVTGSLRGWYSPSGAILPARRVSFAFRLDGFRGEQPASSLAAVQPRQLGHVLQEELRGRGEVLVGLQLRVRGVPAEHRLEVHLLVQVEGADGDEALRAAEELADDLRLALDGCPSRIYAGVRDKELLTALLVDLPTIGAVVQVPPGRSQAMEPSTDGRELARLLLASESPTTALLSMSPSVDLRIVDDWLESMERAVPLVEAAAEAAHQHSRDGRTVSRVYPHDLVGARRAREFLTGEVPRVAEIARSPTRVRLAVVGSQRLPRPLLRAVASTLAGEAHVAWRSLGVEQARRFSSGPLEALGCPLGAGDRTVDVLHELRAGSEVGALLQVPTVGGALPGIPLAPPSDRPAPPTVLRQGAGTLLGSAAGPRGEVDVFLSDEALARHVYLCGKTGVGKSTALETLVADLVQRGDGVALIDPHGDLVDAVRAHIPAGRRVVVFDPASSLSPAIDPLGHDGTAEGIESAVEALTEVMFRLYPPEYMGPMFDRQSRALLVPLAAAGQPLEASARFVSDSAFRRSCLQHLDEDNPLQAEVAAFWKDEYARWSSDFKGEMNSYTVSKYDTLLKSSLLRRACAADRPQLNLTEVLDRGDILLARLPEGTLGPVTSWFLGLLLMGRLQRAVFGRSGSKASCRRPFTLVLDEFQNFLGAGGFGYARRDRTLGPLLSEARKLGLRLVLANQFLSQLDDDTRAALLGNVGSLACFRVGARDAALVVDEFGGVITREELVEQPLFRARARLLVERRPSEVFTLRTFPPAELRARFGSRPVVTAPLARANEQLEVLRVPRRRMEG